MSSRRGCTVGCTLVPPVTPAPMLGRSGLLERQPRGFPTWGSSRLSPGVRTGWALGLESSSRKGSLDMVGVGGGHHPPICPRDMGHPSSGAQVQACFLRLAISHQALDVSAPKTVEGWGPSKRGQQAERFSDSRQNLCLQHTQERALCLPHPGAWPRAAGRCLPPRRGSQRRSLCTGRQGFTGNLPAALTG